MNRTLIKFLVATLLLLALPWAAMAYPNRPYPHDATNIYNSETTCAPCHATQAVLGYESWNYVCTSCHSPGNVARTGGNIPAFALADYADPFNHNTSVKRSVKKQISHSWVGSDNVPAAGALPPLGTSPLAASFPGSIACVRCHNITSGSTLNHLLREDNTNDTLCLDCHRQRNTTNHLTGTHPVNIAYATSVNVSASPVSSNPANPTASMKLSANGNVVCTTCHSVHFADSNSATFDNASSARFGQLSTSKGYLLRTDLRGATADARNICTNCHINKMSHNGAGQNMQCSDCHGGHVDTGDGAPNYYLIRRIINGNTVFFQATGAQRNYVGGNGICVACHPVPAPGGIDPRTGATYPSQHASNDPNVCNLCHKHSASVGSFSGGCITCHGFPPQATSKASGYTGDEATSKHVKHAGGIASGNYAYACLECHYPVDAPKVGKHADGSYQDVFVPAGPIASSHGLTPAYNGVAKTCSNVYCHSNGAPTGGTLVPVTTPAWNGGTTTCSSCHEASPTTNAHQPHITGAGFGCVTCHSATVSNNTTIANRANHANNQKDILFYSQTLPMITGGSSCATVYCHSNGKGTYTAPAWTAPITGQCGVCHGADTPAITTGAHQAHLVNTYGPVLNTKGAPTLASAPSCATCHTTFPTDHLNGSIQSPSNCTTACHPNGFGTATWTSGTRISDCTLCHSSVNASFINKYAPDKSEFFTTTGHGQFPASNACTNCHDNTKPHIGVVGGTKRLINDPTTVCTTCHNNVSIVTNTARQNMRTHFTFYSSGVYLGRAKENLSCQNCHDPHGTSNLHNIKTSIAFINSTSWTINFNDETTGWVNTTTNRGLCQVCHTRTLHYRAGVPDTTNHPTTGCQSCHDHKASMGAFWPNGNCDSCHGYPPVPRNVAVTFGIQNNWSSAKFEDYSGGGGAHVVAGHIPPGANAKEAWTNCGVCHNSGQSHLMQTPVKTHIRNVTVKVDPKFRFNAAQFITYTGAKLVDQPAVNNSGKCFNVSCHFAPSPKWSTEK